MELMFKLFDIIGFEDGVLHMPIVSLIGLFTINSDAIDSLTEVESKTDPPPPFAFTWEELPFRDRYLPDGPLD